MNIKYLKNNQIDKIKWDECIEKSYNSHIYGFTWFLDIMTDNWDAIILNDYDAVMPLNTGRKYFINYIYNPNFVNRFNIYSENHKSEDLLVPFLEKIPKKFQIIDLNLDFITEREIKNFTQIRLKVQEINLNATYEEISKNFIKQHRRHIRKSYDNNLKIRHENYFEHIIENRKKIVEKKNLKQFSDVHFVKLSRLLEYGLKKKIAKIYNVYSSEGILCASMYFINVGKTVITFSSVDELGRKLNAKYFIIDNFIKENCQKDLILDFAGSSIKSIAYFNEGFGAATREYTQFRKNSFGKLKKILAKLKQK